jgi:pimeloyl-ACP methyl ester carboxylesterase
MSAIVYVHGMWMPAAEMAWIRNYIAKSHRLDGELFGYPSVQGTLDENAELLADFVAGASKGGNVHLVGHSLGGVLSLRMLALNPEAPVDRVVCIGSPLCGSRVAQSVNQHEWGRVLLGKSVSDGVADVPASRWAEAALARHETGIIAGTVSAGLGRLVTSFDGPNDGTVAVSETQIPGAKDQDQRHIQLQIRHWRTPM